MLDRQAILPLLLGLLVAVVGHLAVSAEVARRAATPESPNPSAEQADLAVTALDAERLVKVGQPVSPRALIANRGQTRADPALARWSIDGQPGQTTMTPALDPGAEAGLSRSITFDRPGAHRLSIAVDPAGELPDRDRSNNRRSVTILARAAESASTPEEPARPDLAPVSLEPIGPLFAGQPARFAARIANLGNAPAEGTAIEIELDDLPITTGTIDQPIASGEVVVKELKLVVDRPGPHRLCLVADPSDMIDERDERNNRRCTDHVWRSVDSKQQPGQEQTPDELTVNWISYDAFEEMVATHQAEQAQPLVQRSVDPAPVDRAPLKATPPAPRPAEAKPGDPGREATDEARPTRPTRPPRPTAPAKSSERSADESSEQSDEPSDEQRDERVAAVDAPRAEEPRRAIDMPELPSGDEAAASRRDEMDSPTPLEETPEVVVRPRPLAQPEVEVVEPDDRAPEDARTAAETALTNPPLGIEAPMEGGPAATRVAKLPPAARAERRTLPLPRRAEPRPAPATAEVEAPDPREPDPAAIDLPARPEQTPVAAEPAPEDATEDDRRTTEPRPAEDTDRAQAQPDDLPSPPESPPPPQPTEDQPEPTPSDSATTATAGKPSNPTAAPRDRREAMPATRIVGLKVRPGRVVARRGIRINTVAPDFSVPARLATTPRSPIFNVRFNADGEVIDVETLRSTGYPAVDSPLIIALYQWTAEGAIEDDGFLLERLRITFGGGDDED